MQREQLENDKCLRAVNVQCKVLREYQRELLKRRGLYDCMACDLFAAVLGASGA